MERKSEREGGSKEREREEEEPAENRIERSANEGRKGTKGTESCCRYVGGKGEKRRGPGSNEKGIKKEDGEREAHTHTHTHRRESTTIR